MPTPPVPPLPPTSLKSKAEGIKKSFLGLKIFSNLKVIVTTLTIIIIIALSFLYYYYGVLLIPVSEFSGTTEKVGYGPENLGQENPGTPQTPEAPDLPETPQQPQLPEGEYTKITSYFPPAVLPTATKQGKCQLNSIAQPYRQDTWRCVAENKVYDPCFAIQEDKVICQMNPLVNDIFIIKLASPLLPKTAKDNWAWFLTFNDGTYCAPYTGRRPQVQNEEVYYGCKTPTGNQTMVILGELKKSTKWTARTAILLFQNNQWKVSSIKEMEVKEVWQ